ncbi:MAG TPA: cation:proton antiporter [Terriglobales bacterium]|nr:cation:proton antiporter [Terriglobales bacterium]
MANVALYRDLAYVFVGAVIGGLAARKLRQPTILGYVLAGIVIGPFTPGPRVHDAHSLELLAEIGVILLMYSIGIEFSPRDLLQVKWVSLIGGPIGIFLSIGMGIAVGLPLGWSWMQGATMGAILSVASTMVLSRLLIDSNRLLSSEGKAMIGITLMEDFAVVVMTIVLPVLSNFTPDKITALGMSFLKAALILIPVAFLAAKLVPPLLARVAGTKSAELLVLVAVALGFGIAALTQEVGLSLAVGAFLAGMVISGSQYAHETLSQLLPLRDVFVALFFVTIGTLVNPRALLTHPGLLLVLLAMIIAGKFVIWAMVALLFRYPWRSALRIGIGLTQIGEFSYVLVQVAKNASLIDDTFYNATLMASLVSILLNAFLVRASERMLPPVPEAAA